MHMDIKRLNVQNTKSLHIRLTQIQSGKERVKGMCLDNLTGRKKSRSSVLQRAVPQIDSRYQPLVCHASIVSATEPRLFVSHSCSMLMYYTCALDGNCSSSTAVGALQVDYCVLDMTSVMVVLSRAFLKWHLLATAA